MMKKLWTFFVAVMMLMSSLAFCAGAAATEYNYKGFRLFMPTEFVQDMDWAKKYNYVDYWHSEDYKIEMVLIDSDFPQEDFIEKHPDEPYYDCHVIHDKLYGYASDLLSEEEIEINGNKGVKRTYKKEILTQAEGEWEVVNCVSYVFESEDDYYEVRFYIHHEFLYGFYPDMIMDSFDISPFTFFLRNRTWILCLAISPIVVAIVEKRRKKIK